MGLEFKTDVPRNSVKIYRTVEENTSATSADGRSLIPFTNAKYLQDGTVISTTARVDIAGNPLPPSGNSSTTSVVKTSG